MDPSSTAPAPAPEPSNKRPRSPASDFPQIASKAPKTQSNQLQINYLARLYSDNLPLVSVDDTMPAVLSLIGEYDGVLQRHESIAGNLGACPLGPILIKRFERLFDGPPRVLKSNGKDAPNVTWLDVVEFAKSKPEQFNLEKTRNGVRVCQFYTKQCRVEISEEDFVVIASGMPQKMIPPQPIIEDEEKELATLEILDKKLHPIVQVADQLSARARQLKHRLKNRRTAIIARRENDASLKSQQPSASSPSLRDSNGHVQPILNGNGPPPTQSPPGFVAVNSNRPGEPPKDDSQLPPQFTFPHSNTDNVTIINGTSIRGASPTTRAELMKKFFTTADRQARGLEELNAHMNQQQSRPQPRASEPADYNMYNPAPAPATVPIPNTPSSLLPPPRSNQTEKDDAGPFKMHMVARMEELERGERVMPPCDRCRRLQMDCVKNLTACQGCTKKHAKCSWREVREEEIREAEALRAQNHTAEARQSNQSTPVQGPAPAPVPGPAPAPAPAHPIQGPEGLPRPEFTPRHEYNHDRNYPDSRRESEPVTNHSSGPRLSHEASPRRAVSEVQGSGQPTHDNRQQNHHSRSGNRADDDDPDANSRLMQAILDTVHSREAAAKGNEGEARRGEKEQNTVRV